MSQLYLRVNDKRPHRLTKNAYAGLGQPSYVIIGYDEKAKKLLIKKTTKSNKGAIKVRETTGEFSSAHLRDMIGKSRRIDLYYDSELEGLVGAW